MYTYKIFSVKQHAFMELCSAIYIMMYQMMMYCTQSNGCNKKGLAGAGDSRMENEFDIVVPSSSTQGHYQFPYTTYKSCGI